MGEGSLGGDEMCFGGRDQPFGKDIWDGGEVLIK